MRHENEESGPGVALFDIQERLYGHRIFPPCDCMPHTRPGPAPIAPDAGCRPAGLAGYPAQNAPILQAVQPKTPAIVIVSSQNIEMQKQI